MLTPKRTKYRRPHRVKYEGKAKGGMFINFGDYGLMATQGAWITNRQIEAARIAMTRYMKRQGKVWIRIFPHMAKTAKPLEVHMDPGKAPRTDLSPLSNRERSCLKSAAYRKTSLAKRFASPSTNSR